MTDQLIKDPFVTTRGFINRYMNNLKKCRTNEEAYELTEQEYKSEYGIQKYSSYDSFRVVKNRKFKRN